MKIVDRLVLVVFVIALIILCFFQKCTLDIYFLVYGFAVAAMCGVTLYLQSKKSKQSLHDAKSEAKGSNSEQK